MDRQAFRNRMQQLKQYREQNPGKTYLDFKKYAEGGEIPPNNKPIIPEEPQPYKGKLYKDRYGRKYTEDQLADYYDNSTDEIDRFTGKPFVRGLKPVGDIEDAANMAPVGDAISAYDIYSSIKQSDWQGAGLAAMGLIPFMPTGGNKLFRRSATILKYINWEDLSNERPDRHSTDTTSQYPIPNHKDGGIHIKKKNRGKLTATSKKTGKSFEQLKHSKNPLTRKRATFAINARKWAKKRRK